MIVDIDVIGWKFEPTGQQTWVKDGQQLHVEVDEYGFAEIMADTLKSLLIAAQWVRLDREHSGPAP